MLSAIVAQSFSGGSALALRYVLPVCEWRHAVT